MAERYMGEYGITWEGAALDTIGVEPDSRHQGMGALLMRDIFDHDYIQLTTRPICY